MKSNPHGLLRGGEQDMEQDHTPRKRVPEGENPPANHGGERIMGARPLSSVRQMGMGTCCMMQAGVSARAPNIPAAWDVHPRPVHVALCQKHTQYR